MTCATSSRASATVAPDALIVVGGHSAAAYPAPFFEDGVDAICLDDGERAVPALVDAIAGGRPLDEVPGWLLQARLDLAADARARDAVLARRRAAPGAASACRAGGTGTRACTTGPTYLIETARGCPFRCSFCSVWQLFDRSVRERSIESVCQDFATTGDQVFVADDLFWHHPSRSRALADALAGQTTAKGLDARPDARRCRCPASRSARSLAADRPRVRHLLRARGRDRHRPGEPHARTRRSIAPRRRVEIARELGYGVTGNFVIDPDWTEADFERLWAFVETHQLVARRLHDPDAACRARRTTKRRATLIRAVRWSQFDMHHLLWEPRLGVQRFFELYCETWRRSVLNLKGEKKLWHWLAHAKPRHWVHLLQVLYRTQRMMQPSHYVRDHALLPDRAGARARRWPAELS